MPLLQSGSLVDIMAVKYPNGVKNEIVIASLLKETLKGLKYFHNEGRIHRDIKAGNILMDNKANTYISDFGVSAHQKPGQRRNTFVGSPCWMAPEVMEQKDGYDIKADIWSLGITAIEIAEGSAPNSELPPMHVLIKIINDPSPSLDKEEWSPEFYDFVKCCLNKRES